MTHPAPLPFTPLAYALAYADMGWHVLPLEPRSKVPLGRMVPRGMLDATTDKAQIREWWSRVPDAGIGIALAPSGLVAIDVDPRNGGTETFDDLQARHGSLRSDVNAITGGGGEHHVFVLPAGHQVSLPGKLGPGVDVKCNGYIVVEPSIHPSGKTYSWEFSSNPLDGVVPSPLPDWLRNLQIEKPHTPSATGVERVGEGGRNDFLSRRAYALRRLGLPIDLLEQAVERLNETHCVPPLDRAEARAIARGKAGIPSDAIVSTYISRRTEDEGLLLNLAQLEKASAAISWVVKHVIPADSVGVLFGGSGTFKSFVALDFCLHVAHGLPWLGRKTKRSPIIYIAAEGGAGLWRRIHAWHKHHKLDPKGIEFYVVPVSLDIIQNAGLVVEAAQAIGVTPGVVAVDTMSQTFSGEENSANEVAEYLRTLSNHFRYLWAAAVLVIHHSGHQVTERPRGSSAIRANVDFMYGCFRDEKQMLARLECHKQKDGDYPPELRFVLDQVKLGFDEDGDVVSSLVASYTEDEAEIEARKAAASDKSGGHEYMALGLAQPGMTVQVWRRAFYETLPKMDQPSKRKAFHRACERLVGHDKPIDIDLPVVTDKARIVRVNGVRFCQE